ncbi:hypothetical protein N1031_17940 [Herbiconiux moechotypicola]|uniref:DUF4190 domain-containing protein n=1 Tax=Herbiconiux moechotypicola TaxID=637393 RepID=A0ABN3E3R1_9MICO|nr:hypothetical protein [Herbiconiux moechotypicola]MCS5731642.1 hypothetical protein [Herbiconiux moechotypicola]
MSQPAFPGQPFVTPAAPAPPSGKAAANPLGFVSLVMGTVPSLLGIVFLLVQAALLGVGDPATIGSVSTANTVLSGLFGIAAVVLAIVALTRRGASKVLAAAGLALGAATLVGVFGNLLYVVVIGALYGF